MFSKFPFSQHKAILTINHISSGISTIVQLNISLKRDTMIFTIGSMIVLGILLVESLVERFILVRLFDVSTVCLYM